MKPIRIMIVCVFGLGTSMILKMTLDSVLQSYGIPSETFCESAEVAAGQSYDIVLTSKSLSHLFQNSDKPVIVIEKYLSKDEVKNKVMPVIRQLIKE
jgi:PTS system ascorbate-specific IIB component